MFESTVDLRTGIIKVKPVSDRAPHWPASEVLNPQSQERRNIPVLAVRSKAKENIFPEGTVESLRPMIQEVFDLHGVDQDTGYWTKLEQDGEMPPTEACNQLNARGISPLATATAVINSDQQFKMAEAFGNITKEFKQFALSRLAWHILSYYPDESQAKWAQELRQLPGTTR